MKKMVAPVRHQDHLGQEVSVGGMQVYLGGAMYRPLMDLSNFDMICPFLEKNHPALERALSGKVMGRVRHYPIPDFAGVPEDWNEFLSEVIWELKRGRKVIAFCMGGHGRTGTFLASLIAILESGVEDPIAEARSRYCEHAVETVRQAAAIFDLKGQPLPAQYRK